MSGGIWSLVSGRPSSIASRSMDMVGSEEVAVWTSSQVTTDVASRVAIRDSCSRVSESSMSWLASEKMLCGPVSTRSGIFICGWSWCGMELTSSWRCSLSGEGSPVGWRERVSGALFFTPGMCTIENLYRRVFSFKFLRRALLISSERSPKIFRRGRWSTAMVRS